MSRYYLPIKTILEPCLSIFRVMGIMNRSTKNRNFPAAVTIVLLLGVLLFGCQSNRTVDGSGNKSLATAQGIPLSIDVVTNRVSNADKFAPGVSISIVSQPANGTATARPDNLITYTPNANFVGNDSFIYQINTPDGAPIVASLSIDVICPTCAGGGGGGLGQNLTLSWQPIPGSDPVTYIIYYGYSSNSTSQVVMQTQKTQVTMDPSLTLKATPGDTICFRLRAQNSSGISGFSAPACLVYS